MLKLFDKPEFAMLHQLVKKRKGKAELSETENGVYKRLKADAEK
jgi:hypothetical protein